MTSYGILIAFKINKQIKKKFPHRERYSECVVNFFSYDISHHKKMCKQIILLRFMSEYIENTVQSFIYSNQTKSGASQAITNEKWFKRLFNWIAQLFTCFSITVSQTESFEYSRELRKFWAQSSFIIHRLRSSLNVTC